MFFFVEVNQKVINVFYSSLKMKVKVVSVNVKIGILKMIFLAIFHIYPRKDRWFSSNKICV